MADLLALAFAFPGSRRKGRALAEAEGWRLKARAEAEEQTVWNCVVCLAASSPCGWAYSRPSTQAGG